MTTSARQPYSWPRRLQSQSGAFDLPSILVGVVVVGILTAGVMAAVFGVIPWAQDRSAKQDLAAINTAQGVTYAKDGQRYKDLAGLEDAGLVSDLDPETTTVAVSDEGQGFRAEVTAGNGNTWYITHRNNVPEQLTGPGPDNPGAPSGEGSWATGMCTPNLEASMELELSMVGDPGALEMHKSWSGLEADQAAIQEWEEKYSISTPPVELTKAEKMMAYPLGQMINARYTEVAADPALWPQWQENMLGPVRASFKSYCDTNQGDPAYEYYPSRAPAAANESPYAPYSAEMSIAAGSHEPFVIGFPLKYDPSRFTVSPLQDRIPGFGSGVLEVIDVDGSPYVIYTMTPDEGGWRPGDGALQFEFDSDSHAPGTFNSALKIYVE